MTPPKSPTGAPLRFLTELLDFSGDECVDWPFTKNIHGRGMVRYNGIRTSAHRAMCIMKRGEPPFEKAEAAHSCGKGHEGCVNPNHLSWKTSAGNKADRQRHGTYGMRFSAEEVTKIRELGKTMIQKDIAKLYGVNREAIGRIQRGKTWSWL